MLKFYFSFLILVCLSAISFAQSIQLKEYQKKYPDSDYVILEKKSEISYFVVPGTNTLKAKLSHIESILVLTDNSSIINLIQVPYSSFEDATITSAKYFKIDSLNKKTLVENVKTKYIESKNYYIENIFYSDLKVKQFANSLPTGKGSLLTYSYEKTFHDLKFIDKINLQPNNAYVEDFEFSIKAPKANQVEFKIHPVNFSYNDFSIQESTIGNDRVQKIKLQTIAPKKTHRLTPPSNYFSPHFLIVTNSYKINDRKYVIVEKLEDLYSWYSSLIQQLPPTSDEIKKLTKQITQSATTPEASIEAIFKWVQNNIQYVAFEDGIAGFKPENSLQVYQMRSGDCKGMSNLLVDLLRSAGFNAYHTWIGTRHLNYDYSIPSLYVDNHMICALEHNAQFYFLDATSKATPWNTPPDHIQGKQAMIGLDGSYKLAEIPVSDVKTNTISINAEINLSTPEKPTIKGTLVLKGEPRYNILAQEIYSSEKNKKHIPEKLVSKYVSTLNQPSSNPPTQSPTEYAVSFKAGSLNNYGLNNQLLLLNTDLDRFLYSTSTDSSNLPVYIDNTLTLHSNLVYTLPVQAKTPNLPSDITYSSPDGLLKFSIQYKVQNNKIIYEKKISINTLLVKNTDDWNAFILALEKAYDHLVTIKLN